MTNIEQMLICYTRFPVCMCLYPFPSGHVFIPVSQWACVYTCFPVGMCLYPFPRVLRVERKWQLMVSLLQVRNSHSPFAQQTKDYLQWSFLAFICLPIGSYNRIRNFFQTYSKLYLSLTPNTLAFILTQQYLQNSRLFYIVNTRPIRSKHHTSLNQSNPSITS
jgi:hypothetical protein